VKKPIALVVALLLSVLAACGGGGGGDDDGGSVGGSSACPVNALDKVTAPVKITFWHAMGGTNGEVLTKLVKQYNASQKKVSVSLAFQGSYDEVSDKYVTALRGGDLPEVVQLEETRLQLMIDSKSIVPAQECVDAAKYDLSHHAPVVLKEWSVDGVLWPMPFNVSNPVLYFNSKAFEKAGLDPANPPTTFDGVVQAARTMVDKGVAKHGFAVELAPWYIEQWFSKANEPIVDNDNGRSGRATKALIDSPAGKEAFGFVKKLVDDGLALNVGRNASGQDHLVAVATGNAGMTIGTSAAIGGALDVLATGQFPDVALGVGPMPGPDSPDGGTVPGGAALYIVKKGRSPEQIAASWDFLRWLNEPEQQATWHAGTGYIPIREDATELPAVQQLWKERPQFKVAYDQVVSSRSALGGPVIGAYKEFREAIVTAMERMILQGQSVDDSLAQAQKEATAAIESYNERVG
jgi:sn-glycerol 3-phosphate transport system substrate-binding protein